MAFRIEDGAAFLARADPDTYDLVYADAWPGKFTHLEAALACIRQGGVYVIDDLLPQANWPDGHAAKVDALIADLERRRGFADRAAGLGVGPDAGRATGRPGAMSARRPRRRGCRRPLLRV